jgi:hypothetical protein
MQSSSACLLHILTVQRRLQRLRVGEEPRALGKSVTFELQGVDLGVQRLLHRVEHGRDGALAVAGRGKPRWATPGGRHVAAPLVALGRQPRHALRCRQRPALVVMRGAGGVEGVVDGATGDTNSPDRVALKWHEGFGRDCSGGSGRAARVRTVVHGAATVPSAHA